MGNDIKGQQSQNIPPSMAEMEQSLNCKLPYARPIIEKIKLGTDDISLNPGAGNDGNPCPFNANS